MKKILPIIILFVFAAAVYAVDVFTSHSATPQGNQVELNWVTNNEDNVKHFAIQRSMNGDTYIEISTVNPQGPGHRYQFEDKDVLVNYSGAIFYKIVAVREAQDGTSLENASSGPMMVHPNISGIFQTWGAIKAMFR